MTVQLASRPAPVDLDIEAPPLVVARVSLRGGIVELDTLAGRLSDLADEAASHQSKVRSFIRRHENAWLHMLSDIATQSSAAVAVHATATFDLYSELGRIDAEITGLRERARGLEEGAQTLREVLDALMPLDDAACDLDESAARYSRACRRVQSIMHRDYDAITDRIMLGPMQAVADIVVNIELIERLMLQRSGAALVELQHCRRCIDTALAQLLAILDDVEPAELFDGLVAGLRAVVRRVDGATARLDVIGEERALPRNLTTTVFRIAHEAITNAQRHGRAGHIEVVLSFHPRRVILVVRDDGDGFDVVATEARLGRTDSLGLLTMRERAALELGTVDIRSEIECGTEVRATFEV